ncbi:hypothetical protein HA402_006694 [Bradysia odoriphaga]|nr:hypothetical protein HA402_006694 [Bradysia odoriphaga]
MNQPNKEPYNDINFTLSIKLDTPPAPMSPFLLNLQAASDAQLVDIQVDKIYRFDDNDEIIEYTEEEKNTLVVFNEESIVFQGPDNFKKEYKFPTKRVTMKQFVEAIVDFEKQDRVKSEWFGGIDCHHIFYEGLHPTADGAYIIFWGS